MTSEGSALASRFARGPFIVFSLAVLAVGAVALARHDPAPAGPERTQVQRRDPDTLAYGPRIAVPASALATVREFIRAAVLRKNLKRAWQLSAPPLRAGMTRSEWLAGSIPVMPSPARVFRRTSFTVVRARERDLLLLVNGEFFVELVPGAAGWIVNYWAPRGHTGPVPAVP